MSPRSKSRAELTRALLSHMKHAYLQTNGTMLWPNSWEGDMLRSAYNILAPKAPAQAKRKRAP